MTENYLDILADTIRNNWNQPALTDFYLTEDGKAQDTSRGNHYTYGEMYAEIVRISDLLTTLGLEKGDHIAICGANSAHWVIAYLAIAKMQGVSVTIMYSLPTDEIARLIDFSDAKALFVDRELWTDIEEQFIPQIQSVVALEDWNVIYGEQICINEQLQFTNDQCQFVHGTLDELAMMCFTSGSTNIPKGVMLSYRGLSDSLALTIFKMDYWETLKNTRRPFLATMPMAHMFGLTDNVLCHLVYGKQVIIYAEYLSIEHILAVISICCSYGLAIIPSIFEKLIIYSQQNNCIQILRSLEYIVVAGAKVASEVEKMAISINLPYYVGYGLSEIVCVAASKFDSTKRGNSGKILGSKEITLVNGEILVKGENVMLGYYKDPEATAAKIDAEGWLHTGDKGHLDEDGYLYVEGRLEQDIIVLPNGENICPDNIESLVNALPEVSESIVLARDGRLVAIVVPKIRNQKSPYGVSRSEEITNADFRCKILHKINPLLPLYSQLDKVEISNVPLVRTSKQTLKRYLYK